MKRWIIGLIVLTLSACGSVFGSDPTDQTGQSSKLDNPQAASTQVHEVKVPLENYGPAPELTNEVWLNIEQPLRLADLRGKVVLLDMWTFG